MAPESSISDPISRANLVEVFLAAARPDPTTHMVGTELEKFGIDVSGATPQPISYDAHIVPVLQRLVEKYGWQHGPDRGDDGEIIELIRDGASITLEPGGQLELSGKPLHNVHETCAEFTQHYHELHEISEDLGIAWLTTGYHPFAEREEIHWMPKPRYRIMRNYLPTRGGRGLDMMLRTCTVQANFDYRDERQCAKRLRLASILGPVIAAWFANSPFETGEHQGFRSSRNRVWLDVDPDRCGVPEFVLDDGFSFERYVDWALDVPMFFVKRAAPAAPGREPHLEYHEHHATFRRFLAEGFTDRYGQHHLATHADWTTHLSTLFPEVRLKPYIEVRSADAVGSRYVCALPALLKGLLYDDAALEDALGLFGPETRVSRDALWEEAARAGLQSPRLHNLAHALIGIARVSLERQNIVDQRGRTEARFLDPLEALVEGRESPADAALRALGPAPGRTPEGRRALVRAFHFAGAFG